MYMYVCLRVYVCREPDSVHDFFRFFLSPRSAPSKIPLIAKSHHSFILPIFPIFHSLALHPFDIFPSGTPAENLKLINKSLNKSSSMDFILTSLIKSCFAVFSEIIFNPANLSISQGSFSHKFKLAQVTPLLKTPGLDKNTPSNYRLISNLNSMFKLLERLILSRIQYHTTSSYNFNHFQAAYRRYPLSRLCCWP